MQQNSSYLGRNQQQSSIAPFTFHIGELDSLRGKLSMGEQQLLSSHSKNPQFVMLLTSSEITTLQKMIEMTYLQGLSGSGSLQQSQNQMNSSMTGMKSNMNTGTPPSNYSCHKCGIQGHYVYDCPNVTGKGPPPTNYVCHKCNIQGHWIQECPLGSQQDSSKPPPNYCCHRCGVPGHWIKNCPTNVNNTEDWNGYDNDKMVNQREEELDFKRSTRSSNPHQNNHFNKKAGTYFTKDVKHSKRDTNSRIHSSQNDHGYDKNVF